MGNNKNKIAKNIYEKKTQAELASFLHATCFSPVESTLIKAVKNGNFETWPGLTAELIAANLPKQEATFLRHFDQTRKNPDQQKVRNYHWR